MNTHILISIEDVKDKIALYKEDIKTSENGGDSIRAAAFSHMLSELEDILKIGKQISLNEEDIEEKAWKALENSQEDFSDDTSGSYLFRQGVKQALKDLPL